MAASATSEAPRLRLTEAVDRLTEIRNAIDDLNKEANRIRAHIKGLRNRRQRRQHTHQRPVQGQGGGRYTTTGRKSWSMPAGRG